MAAAKKLKRVESNTKPAFVRDVDRPDVEGEVR